MANSDVSICNQALSRLGAEAITGFDDAIDRRRLELDLGLAIVQADALRLLRTRLAVDDDLTHEQRLSSS